MMVSVSITTIKGGSRHAEKNRKGLMMMKANKMGWAGVGAGQEQARIKARAKQKRKSSKAGVVHITNFIITVVKHRN